MPRLRVFISWSGPRSRLVAQALADWLPLVLQAVDPWISTGIEAGARWQHEIGRALEEARVAVVCLTPENQRQPWILFEAGACAKSLDRSRVCPYLLGMADGDVEEGPLQQFQMKTATRDGTWHLIQMIRRTIGDGAVSETHAEKTFDRFWPDLEAALSKAVQTEAVAVKRELDTKVDEILSIVRAIARPSATQEPNFARFREDDVDQEIGGLRHPVTVIGAEYPAPLEGQTRAGVTVMQVLELLGARAHYTDANIASMLQVGLPELRQVLEKLAKVNVVLRADTHPRGWTWELCTASIEEAASRARAAGFDPVTPSIH